MKKLRMFLAVAAVAGVAGTASAKNPKLPVCIELRDRAGVPTPLLLWSEAQAAIIFRPAGIDLVWRGSAQEGCILMTIVRNAAEKVSPDAMGFAHPFADNGPNATILYERVELLAESIKPIPEYTVLGHIIAHEIGHLLLRTTEHSTAGLMRASWKPPEWRLAAAGLISIERVQARRMVENLRSREIAAPSIGALVNDPGVRKQSEP
jgi:hypothetical protein